MTWSPFFTLVTPGPTSTTTPAPSWPRIAGKMPSGSAPDSVNSSVWQMPVALISTSTSPALGPSRSTSMISSGFPAATATAARVFMGYPPMRFSSAFQEIDEGSSAAIMQLDRRLAAGEAWAGRRSCLLIFWLGLPVISATVVIHTFGLIAVTHVVGALTGRFGENRAQQDHLDARGRARHIHRHGSRDLAVGRVPIFAGRRCRTS